MTNTGFHRYSNRQVRMGDGRIHCSFVGLLEEMVAGGARKGSASRTVSFQDKAGSKRVISRLVLCHPTKGVIRRGFVFKPQQAATLWG